MVNLWGQFNESTRRFHAMFIKFRKWLLTFVHTLTYATIKKKLIKFKLNAARIWFIVYDETSYVILKSFFFYLLYKTHNWGAKLTESNEFLCVINFKWPISCTYIWREYMQCSHNWIRLITAFNTWCLNLLSILPFKFNYLCFITGARRTRKRKNMKKKNEMHHHIKCLAESNNEYDVKQSIWVTESLFKKLFAN